MRLNHLVPVRQISRPVTGVRRKLLYLLKRLRIKGYRYNGFAIFWTVHHLGKSKLIIKEHMDNPGNNSREDKKCVFPTITCILNEK